MRSMRTSRWTSGCPLLEGMKIPLQVCNLQGFGKTRLKHIEELSCATGRKLYAGRFA